MTNRQSLITLIMLGLLNISSAADKIDAMGLHIYNGSMELGEIDKPIPGYSMTGFFEPKKAMENIDTNYFPTTKQEAGNKYLLMPGYKGLPEYNMNCDKFFIKKSGKVELTFKAKYVADINGEYQDKKPVYIDFRCRNQNRLYGTVKERYPVLITKTFRPKNEWTKFKFAFDVVGNYEYKMMFRRFTENILGNFNGLCIDDLSLKYLESPAPGKKVEIAFIADRLISSYFKNEKIEWKVNAKIPDGGQSETIKISVVKNYSDEITKSLNVTMNKQSDSGDIYTGKIEFESNYYGSFNTICEYKGSQAPSKGGEFVVLHNLPKDASPLQRKIGAHFRAGGYFQFLPHNVASVRTNIGLNLEAKVYALSGLRHAMYSFDMKKVQADKDKLDFTVPDKEIELLKKYNIEPIGCLGGWWNYQAQKEYKGKKFGRSLPDWFFDPKLTHDRPKNINKGKPVQIPSIDTWKLHVNGIVDRYTNNINKWMTLHEPQWKLTPEEYVELQKVVYNKVKTTTPDSYLIAGNATSDIGYNLTDWLGKLNKLGLGKYSDAISFNPYRSSTDFIDGTRFKYSNLVSRIRENLEPNTDLWLQELYYISSAKHKQTLCTQNEFTAGDVQRHYFLGFINGLKGVTSINSVSSLYSTPHTPSDVSAGLNSMSSFLSGKSEFEPVLSDNKLIRSGILYDESKSNCAAVIWALQPAGGVITLPDTNDISCFDTYGNKLKLNDKMELGLDPIYLVGSYDKLKQITKYSKYFSGVPVKIRSRSFSEIETFYEVENISGVNNKTFLSLGENIPKIRLQFNEENDFQNFSHRGESLVEECIVNVAGEASDIKVNIKHISNAENLSIKNDSSAPTIIKSENGNSIKLWIAENQLCIEGTIIDNEITAVEGDDLYNGDALEVFIDRTPFNRMDIDEINKGADKLEVLQYIFSPAPSKSGKSIVVMNKSINRTVLNSKSTSKVRKTSDGYIINARIPLKEISPFIDNKNIIGINFELCRRDGSKALEKDYFSKSKRPSYKYRRHYRLVKLNGFNPNIIDNGNFERGLTDWKCYQNSKFDNDQIQEVPDSFSGDKAIKVLISEKPSWGDTIKRGSILNNNIVDKGNYILSFYAKGKNIDHFKVRLGKNNVVRTEKDFTPTPDYWTKYKIPLSVNDKGSLYLEFLGLRRDDDTYFIVDDIQLQKQ